MNKKKEKKTSDKNKKIKGLILILLSTLMIFSELLFSFLVNPFYLIQVFTTLLLFGNGLNIVFWVSVILISSWHYLGININFFTKKRFRAFILLLISITLFIISLFFILNSSTNLLKYLKLNEIYSLMFFKPLFEIKHNGLFKENLPTFIYGGIILPFIVWTIGGGVFFSPILSIESILMFLYCVYVILHNDYELFIQKLNPIVKKNEIINVEKHGETVDLNLPTQEFELNLQKEQKQRTQIIEKIRQKSNEENYEELCQKIKVEKERIKDLRGKVLDRISNTKEKNKKNSTISETRRNEILNSLGVYSDIKLTKNVTYNDTKDIKRTFISEEEKLLNEVKKNNEENDKKINNDEVNNKEIINTKQKKEENLFSNEYVLSMVNDNGLNQNKKENEFKEIENYYNEIFSDPNLENDINKTLEDKIIIDNEEIKDVILKDVSSEMTVEEHLTLPNEVEKTTNVKEEEIVEIINVKNETIQKQKKVVKKTPKLEEEEEDYERPKNWCSSYILPSTSILEEQSNQFDNTKLVEEVTRKSKRLNDVLISFGIKASVNSFEIGPTVSTFKIELESGIKTNKVTNLEDNMKLTLGAEYIRIIAPIPGTSFIGIEVPNSVKKPVKFRSVFDETKVDGNESGIQISIGQDVSGRPLSFDLAKAPHLLVAGSTGSGKSVAINTILASILLRYKPTDVQLVLVDPKMVEFTPFHDIPHLMTKVITDPNNANKALKAMVDEMEDRYKEMAKRGVKKLDELNVKLIQNGEQKKPYIVVIIDELADLMMTAAKEVEESIMRITQKARAAGIHMVLATQRPSTEIITGTIKSNIPSRMAFTVASSIDSRTILGKIGAEKLIGMGDMLVSLYGKLPVRGQGAYISNEEIDDITAFTKSQCSPFYSIDLDKSKNDLELMGDNLISISDPMYLASKDIVFRQNKASTSMLQRYLNIGYNRAATIIDTLEAEGIIGPARGSKPREVLVEEEEEE